MSATLADLAGLSDEALAEMYAAGDEAAQAAVLAECQRQDDLAEAARRRQAWRESAAGQRYAAREAAWTDASYAEYLAAEAATRGNMLSREAPDRDPWPMLWTCSDRDFARWASEDMRRWREHDAPAFTRKADYMRAASRPRAGEMPWHGQEAEAAEGVQAPAPTVAVSAGATEAHSGEDGPRDRIAARRVRLAGFAAREQAAREAGCWHSYRWRCEGIAPGACQDCPMLAAETRGAAVAVRAPGDIAQVPPAGLAGRRAEVDGGRLLEQVGLFLLDYASFPSPGAAVACTLWAAHAVARDSERQLIWRASPRLLLTSAVQGSGKSTVLDLLALLTGSRAGRLGTVTAPGLAQLLGRMREPALIDEAQLMFGTGRRSEMVRLIVNAGYTRGGHALTGREGKAALTPVFGAVAMAGLDSLITDTGGRLTDTLARCIVIHMERPDRRLPELDERGDTRGHALAGALAGWTASAADGLRRACLDLADAAAAGDDGLGVIGDGGRVAQIWRPLLALADVAGGMWPAAAREACLELSGAVGDLEGAAEVVAGLDEADSRSFFDTAWGAA